MAAASSSVQREKYSASLDMRRIESGQGNCYISVRDPNNGATVLFFNRISEYLNAAKQERHLREADVVMFMEDTINDQLAFSEIKEEMQEIQNKLEGQALHSPIRIGLEEKLIQLEAELEKFSQRNAKVGSFETDLEDFVWRKQITTLFYETRPYRNATAQQQKETIETYKQTARNLVDKPIILGLYADENVDLTKGLVKPASAHLAAYSLLVEQRFIAPIFAYSDEAILKVSHTIGKIAFTQNSPYELPNFMKGWVWEQVAEARTVD